MVAKRRTVVTFGLALGPRVSKVSTVTGIGGILVAKRRSVVTFGLALGRRASKASVITGLGKDPAPNAELSSLLDGCCVLAIQKRQQSQGSGGPGREMQNCRRFWTCVRSPRLKTRQSQILGGAWARNAELSSLLDLRRVAKRRTVVTLLTRVRFSCFRSVNNHRARKGPGRPMHNCRHLWTRVGSSHCWSRNAESGVEERG